MTRSKALLVAALALVAIAVGATASAAPSLKGQVLAAHTIRDFAHPSAAGAFWNPVASYNSAKGGFAAFVHGKKAPAKPPAGQGETELLTLNDQVAAAINTFRLAHGLTPLTVSADLNASARQHSLEMGAKGYFDHPSANGTAWWKRIQGFYTDNGYAYWTVGENLLFSTDSISAGNALKLWIGSPDHLRNLKDPNWRNLGVSSVRVLHAKGVYAGYDVTIITTDFGARH